MVDVVCRFKAAEPLATKEAKEVAEALSTFTGGDFWSGLSASRLTLGASQVDPGREFIGAVNQLLAKHGVSVRLGRLDIHRDQDIVDYIQCFLSYGK